MLPGIDRGDAGVCANAERFDAGPRMRALMTRLAQLERGITGESFAARVTRQRLEALRLLTIFNCGSY